MRSLKNIEEVMDRKSFPEFFSALGEKVDLKEWSEVGGFYRLIRSLMKNYSPDIIIDVGCGVRPTLATLMALNYPYEVMAIDPELNDSLAQGIERLSLYRQTLDSFVQAYAEDIGSDYPWALVVANHSHSSTSETWGLLGAFKQWIYITSPCCKDNRLRNKRAIHITDPHIHSDKNEMYIYSSLNHGDNVHLVGNDKRIL